MKYFVYIEGEKRCVGGGALCWSVDSNKKLVRLNATNKDEAIDEAKNLFAGTGEYCGDPRIRTGSLTLLAVTEEELLPFAEWQKGDAYQAHLACEEIERESINGRGRKS